MQEPIAIYYQQTRHGRYPLAGWERHAGWRSGQQAWDVLKDAKDSLDEWLQARAQALTEDVNRKFVLTEDFYRREREAKAKEEAQRRAATELLERQQALALQRQQQEQREREQDERRRADRQRHADEQKRAEERQRAQEEQQRAEEQRRASYLTVAPPGKVFMAGDSLMQGIAPYLLRRLRTQYGIGGVDLSKQSTGLSYPKAFNWPETIARTIAADPGIRVLVIMLGPNDPWDIPNPAKPGGEFLRFGSAAWEAVYRQRVADIIQSSAAKGVSTLWVGAPDMKAARLDGQMQWLMRVVQDEVEKQGAVFIDTRPLMLPDASEGYSDSVTIDGKSTKMRSGDGIHFSPAGQKYLAQQILDRLRLPPPAS
jgi:hypothetical protein